MEAHASESEKARSYESDKAHEEVVRINVAQLLEHWGQRLAATMCCRLPMAANSSPPNAYRLLATLV